MPGLIYLSDPEIKFIQIIRRLGEIAPLEKELLLFIESGEVLYNIQQIKSEQTRITQRKRNGAERRKLAFEAKLRRHAKLMKKYEEIKAKLPPEEMIAFRHPDGSITHESSHTVYGDLPPPPKPPQDIA